MSCKKGLRSGLQTDQKEDAARSLVSILDEDFGLEGKRRQAPFCDGSHEGTEFKPLKYLADQSKKVFFCSCKQTND